MKPQYFDPIYRPIAILHARDVDVSSTSAVFKQVILASLERMRRNIAAINKRRRYYRKQVGDDLREVSESESRSDCAWGNTPEDLVLQYTMVVDLEGAPATSVVSSFSQLRKYYANVLIMTVIRYCILVSSRSTTPLLWHHRDKLSQ